MTGFKPARPARTGWPRRLLTVVAALAVGAVLHAWLRPPAPAPAPDLVAASGDGIRVVDGVPVGFPATPRGAGDAAARFEVVLSAAGSLPRQDGTALIRRLYPDVTDADVVQLLPTLPREQAGGIWQSTTVRVWAERADDTAATVPVGGTVRVQTLMVSLFGPGTDGMTGVGDGGPAGMWMVHDLTMRWTDNGWRLADVQSPVPVPPPDVAGTVRDGTPRDGQLLARVLGPDSWGP
ncbi:hypothetical protein AB0H83_29735 [Dactylosporangium sp. NPDC050688]|uniref:hypothetical protein n=1 Tax=Dactylosporangium sp. NPDC050688 TaxID=3157217 RepID=UPI0033EAA88A